MYRRVLLSVAGSVALVSSAFAADIYTPSAPYATVILPPTWAGFYIGANGGYGGNSGLGFDEDVTKVTAAFPTTPQPYSYLRGSDTIAGGFGGGQLGYNFQFGSWVAGFETDIQGSDIQGSGAQAMFNPTIGAATTACGATGFGTLAGRAFGVCAAKSDLSVDWFGTVRGRLGYALGGTLLYATGGLAYGDVSSKLGYTDNSAAVAPVAVPPFYGPLRGNASTSTTTQIGWVAGAGVEYKISPSWSLKGEYQYIDLGSISSDQTETVYGGTKTPTPSCKTTIPGGGGCSYLRGISSDIAFNTVRVGVNYYFNAPPPPLK
ncbi:MAG: outer membrane protein [Rhodomicrobium sp.]